MYRYRPPARVVYAAIHDGKTTACIFKTPPTDAQGDLMARAIDPANVIVPRALLERLAAIEPNSYDEDNGPGRNVCAACGGHGAWNWDRGRVVSVDPLDHDVDCSIVLAKELLK